MNNIAIINMFQFKSADSIGSDLPARSAPIHN